MLSKLAAERHARADEVAAAGRVVVDAVAPAEAVARGVEAGDLKEILVYGFHNSFGTQIGMKLVGDFSSTEEVKQLCLKVLPSFQVPSVIEQVDELPKNGSGKIIRRKTL